MQDIRNTVQKISDDEHKWDSKTYKAQYSEENYAPAFDSPRLLIPKISGEGQIKSRNYNEEQSKKNLLCFC